MSTTKKAAGRPLWNTPAGSGPSPFAQLDMTALSRMSPEEWDELRRATQEKLDNDPVYQAFKRGAEASRRASDPTMHWTRHARDGKVRTWR